MLGVVRAVTILVTVAASASGVAAEVPLADGGAAPGQRSAAAEGQPRLDRAESERPPDEASYPKSRWIALLPFGIGQFQNDDVGLGIVFAALEGAALATSLSSAAYAYGLVGENCYEVHDGYQVDCARLQEAFVEARTVNWVSFGALCALLVGGAVQAEVAFDDDESDVSNEAGTVSSSVAISPDARFEPEGVYLAVVGRF